MDLTSDSTAPSENEDIVVGFDPALTAVGVAIQSLLDEKKKVLKCFKPKSFGLDRLCEFYSFLLLLKQDLVKYKIKMALIEGYAYAPRFGRFFEIGEICGILKLFCIKQLKIKRLITVAPLTLKKWILGIGKGEKSQILLCAYKKWGIEAKTEHEVEAFSLAQIGRVKIQLEQKIITKDLLKKYEIDVLKRVFGAENSKSIISRR